MGKCRFDWSRRVIFGFTFLTLSAGVTLVHAAGQETQGYEASTEKAAPESEPGFWRRSFQPVQFFTNLKLDAKRFNEMDLLARRSSPTQANLNAYAQSGITLSDSACTGWLQTLAYSERDSNFFKDILNIVGNLILGVAGINGANPGSLAKGALGLAAGNATIESYQNEVILGTISDIQSKLEEGRRTSATYFVQHIPDTYDETKRRLAEYHGSCTPGAVKTLLKTSLAAVKYVAPDTTLGGPIGQMKSDILVSQLSSKIFPSGNGIALSDDALYKLYVSKVLLPDSKAEFVTAAEADQFVKFVGASFNVADKDQITLLQAIADLRGYVARAQGELKKETDKALAQKVDTATKDVAEAAAAKDSAVKAKTAKVEAVKKERSAVAATIPKVADKARDSAVSDEELVKSAKLAATSPAEKLAVTKAESTLAESAAAQQNLTAAEKKIQETQLVLTSALNLQSTMKSSGIGARSSTPSSISAVLVPAN